MKIPQVKFMFQSLVPRALLFMLCASFAIVSISAQSSKETPVTSDYNGGLPTVHLPSQNTTCADLYALSVSNPAGFGQFSNLQFASQLKLSNTNLDTNTFVGPPNGRFEFTTGGVRTVVGTPNPGFSILVQSANSNARLIGFNSQLLIQAVLIKAGPDSYGYSYAGAGVFQDLTVTDTGDRRGISHVTFCYGVTLNPSAGEVSVSGRVLDWNGRGISGARIAVFGSTGDRRTILTNQFGYYSIGELDAGETYTSVVSHRRYQFIDNIRTFTLNEDLAENDFVANP